jgi:cyanophycinase-like exopeptidase
MAFGSYTINVRSALTSHKPQWLEALGIARGLITLPHFDRLINFMGPDRYREILESAPFASRLLGVDEDTALVRYCHEGTWQWKVIGRQTVSLMNREGQATVYRSGETVNLA